MSDRFGKPDFSDAVLRKAFMEAGAGDLAEASTERIWRAVTGELDAEERRAVVAETATDPAKAMAWRLASEVLRDARAAGALATPPSQTHVANDVGEESDGTSSEVGAEAEVVASTRSQTWVAGVAWQRVAMAASTLLALSLIVLVLQRGPLQTNVVRGGGTLIEAVIGVSCSESACRLEWSEVEEATSYRIRITTGELDVLVDQSGLQERRYEMSAEELGAAMAAGGRFLWMVEATRTDGTNVASQAFEQIVSRR